MFSLYYYTNKQCHGFSMSAKLSSWNIVHYCSLQTPSYTRVCVWCCVVVGRFTVLFVRVTQMVRCCLSDVSTENLQTQHWGWRSVTFLAHLCMLVAWLTNKYTQTSTRTNTQHTQILYIYTQTHMWTHSVRVWMLLCIWASRWSCCRASLDSRCLCMCIKKHIMCVKYILRSGCRVKCDKKNIKHLEWTY